MKKIYALVIASGEYDDYSRDIIALTTNPLYAQAWPLIGFNKTSCSYEVDEFTLDDFTESKSYLAEIKSFLDPKANPMCECGHTLKEHSSRGKKKCIWANTNAGNPHRGHQCTGFKLTVFVEQPPLAPPIRL